jgi:hypothetical protein
MRRASSRSCASSRCGSDGRLVGHQDADELEPGNVLGEDDQAHRERRGQQQADRPPEPGPERDRAEQGHLRDARALAVDEGFEGEAAGQLQRHEEPAHQEGREPGGEGGQREDHEHEGSHPDADVGDEAQDRGEEAPEQGVRHAQQEQAGRDADAEARVDDGLHQEVVADALAGLVERAGGRGQPSVAGEADDAIPQVLALDQHEDDQDDHRRRAPQAFEQRRELPEAGWLRGDHDRRGLLARAGGAGVLPQLVGDLGDRALRLLERATAAHAAHLVDLDDQVVAVARDLGGEARELDHEDPEHAAERREQHRHHDRHRQAPPQPHPSQPIHDRIHHEREQHRQRDRHQHRPRQIQRRHPHDQRRDSGEPIHHISSEQAICQGAVW